MPTKDGDELENVNEYEKKDSTVLILILIVVEVAKLSIARIKQLNMLCSEIANIVMSNSNYLDC